jgi:hypothetical protein
LFIILEGGDYVGKTTIANALQAKLTRHRDSKHGAGPYYHGGLVMGHYGPPEKSPLLEYTTEIEWYRPGTKIGMLWDRFHLGGPIYGPIYRPKTNREGFGEMGRAGYQWTELFLASRGAVTFLVRQDESVIRERFEQLGEDSYTGKLEAVLKVNAAYDEFFRGPNQPITYGGNIEGHFTNPQRRDEWVDDITDMMISVAAHEANKAAPLADFPSYVGPRDPKVLLLGEKRHLGDDSIMRSAFMPLHGKSGEFMLDSLPTHSTLWKQIGIANALEEDVAHLNHVLGYPQIVALGNTASDVCERADLDHAKVPHPQYVRRFHHHRQNEYGALIQRAATHPPKDYTPWPT